MEFEQNIEKETAKGLKKMIKKLRKSKKRTKIILGIVLIVVLVVAGFLVFRKKEAPYDLGKVMRGDVIENVSATGTVESVEEVDLRFKTGGVIEGINVKVGDKVKKGDYLARLASGDLYSQYLQAQASYNQAKAKLDQLLAGASSEKIRVYEQVAENTRIALEDAKAKAENDLNQDYNSALVYLVNSSSKYNKALADLKDMEKVYFYRSSSLEITFREKRVIAENAYLGISSIGVKGVKEYIDKAINNPTHENIDSALAEMWSALQKITDALDYTKKAMSDSTIREDVSSTDRATIDTDITNINSSFSNINIAKTDIADQKITNQTNINSAESAYKKAQADLEELKAMPRPVDIAIYQADVEKYRANMEEYSQKLKDASIIAPFDGTIAKIDGKIGEAIISGGKVIVSLIAPGNFQIRGDISEADIKKIDLDDPAEIGLDAFPEEVFPGQIIEIEPAETIIEGVVYYRVKILFKEINEKVRSGMTADVIIQTEKKENVLYIPYRSLVFKSNKRFVRIPDGKDIKEIEVETGLKGNNGEIEIISGLNEGDNIISFFKK